MNTDQNRNVEQAIDDLCENLVWSWAYFTILQGLHEVAKSSPASVDPYPQFISCLYHGLFDCLFIRIHNFIDPSKGTCGFHHLFKVLRSASFLNCQAKHEERSSTHFKLPTSIESGFLSYGLFQVSSSWPAVFSQNGLQGQFLPHQNVSGQE